MKKDKHGAKARNASREEFSEKFDQTYVARPPANALHSYAGNGTPPFGYEQGYVPRVVMEAPTVIEGPQPGYHVKITATPFEGKGNKPPQYNVVGGPTNVGNYETVQLEDGKVVAHVKPTLPRHTEQTLQGSDSHGAPMGPNGDIGAQIHVYPGHAALGVENVMNTLVRPAGVGVDPRIPQGKDARRRRGQGAGGGSAAGGRTGSMRGSGSMGGSMAQSGSFGEDVDDYGNSAEGYPGQGRTIPSLRVSDAQYRKRTSEMEEGGSSISDSEFSEMVQTGGLQGAIHRCTGGACCNPQGSRGGGPRLSHSLHDEDLSNLKMIDDEEKEELDQLRKMAQKGQTIPLERGYSRVIPSLTQDDDVDKEREYNWISSAFDADDDLIGRKFDRDSRAESMQGGAGGLRGRLTDFLKGRQGSLEEDDTGKLPPMYFQDSAQLAKFLDVAQPGLVWTQEDGQSETSQDQADRENQVLKPRIIYKGVRHNPPIFGGKLRPLSFLVSSIETHQYLPISGIDHPPFIKERLDPNKMACFGLVPMPFDPGHTGMPAPTFQTVDKGEADVILSPLLRTCFEPELPTEYYQWDQDDENIKSQSSYVPSSAGSISRASEV